MNGNGGGDAGGHGAGNGNPSDAVLLVPGNGAGAPGNGAAGATRIDLVRGADGPTPPDPSGLLRPISPARVPGSRRQRHEEARAARAEGLAAAASAAEAEASADLGAESSANGAAEAPDLLEWAELKLPPIQDEDDDRSPYEGLPPEPIGGSVAAAEGIAGEDLDGADNDEPQLTPVLLEVEPEAHETGDDMADPSAVSEEPATDGGSLDDPDDDASAAELPDLEQPTEVRPVEVPPAAAMAAPAPISPAPPEPSPFGPTASATPPADAERPTASAPPQPPPAFALPTSAVAPSEAATEPVPTPEPEPAPATLHPAPDPAPPAAPEPAPTTSPEPVGQGEPAPAQPPMPPASSLPPGGTPPVPPPASASPAASAAPPPPPPASAPPPAALPPLPPPPSADAPTPADPPLPPAPPLAFAPPSAHPPLPPPPSGFTPIASDRPPPPPPSAFTQPSTEMQPPAPAGQAPAEAQPSTLPPPPSAFAPPSAFSAPNGEQTAPLPAGVVPGRPAYDAPVAPPPPYEPAAFDPALPQPPAAYEPTVEEPTVEEPTDDEAFDDEDLYADDDPRSYRSDPHEGADPDDFHEPADDADPDDYHEPADDADLDDYDEPADDDETAGGEPAYPRAALELRQIAGLTAGIDLELDRAGHEFAEGDQSVAFTITVDDKDRAVLVPGTMAVKLDTQPVTEPTLIGWGALDVGSARFIVRPRRSFPRADEWLAQRDAFDRPELEIEVPPTLGVQPATPAESERNRRRFGRRRSGESDTPAETLNAESWEFIDRIRAARADLANRERYLHPDPAELVVRTNSRAPILGLRPPGHPLFGKVGVIVADMPWMPNFDDIRAIPDSLGPYLQPLMSLPSIPIAADLLIGPLGIVGSRAAAAACARHIILSLHALSTADLRIHIAASPERAPVWDWAYDVADHDDLDLEHGFPVVVVDGIENFGRYGLTHADAIERRVGVVILTDSIDDLPNYCGSVLQVDRSGSALLTNHLGHVIAGTPVGVASDFARHLADDLNALYRQRR